MTKGTIDDIRYFRYITLNKWKGLTRETLFPSRIDPDPARRGVSINILKECAIESGIKVEELADGAFEINGGGVSRRITGLASIENASTNWMCSNKYATYELLRKYGFFHMPGYRRYSLKTINEARQDFLTRGKAVVIKPSRGTAGGFGVTVNVVTMKQLNKAIFSSLRFASDYLMEDFIEGSNFRVLLFKDRLVSAVERLPANVTGDGASNLKRLITAENERRAKDKSLFHLNPIRIDNDVQQTLANNRMSLDHVPAKGERVFVRTVCNHRLGGMVEDVTDIIHPEVVKGCQDIMRIMQIKWGGIDLITKDISKPWAESGGKINEVNTGPGLDIHSKAVTMELLRLTLQPGL